MRRSARRRELANTIVERCASTRSTIASSTCGHTDPVTSDGCDGAENQSPSPLLPAPAVASVSASSSASTSALGGGGGWSISSIGTTTVRSKALVARGATISTGADPPRKRATSSIGRTVAESPMRCAGCSSSASSRSRLTARCAPRLVAATACTSSTMTVCTPRRVSDAWLVSIRYSDSGVVMRMSGGSAMSLRRSADGVSPERTPTVTSGTAMPSRRADWPMPTSGERRFRSTSTPSALRGET